MRSTLEHHGLVPAEADVSGYRWLVLATMSTPVALGIAKIMLGYGRGKAIGYLANLLVLTVFAMLQLLQRPWAT